MKGLTATDVALAVLAGLTSLVIFHYRRLLRRVDALEQKIQALEVELARFEGRAGS